MESNSFFQHLSDLDFTNEEQDVVFTPTFQWDSTTNDSNLLIIGKLVSSRAIDDLVVVCAFQGIWKKISIPSVFMDDDNITHQTDDSLAKRQELVSHSKGSIRYLDSNSSTPILSKSGKIFEPSKTDAATKEIGHTFQPINPSNPDTTTNKIDNASKPATAAGSSTVVPLDVVTQPTVVLAADKADTFPNEDAETRLLLLRKLLLQRKMQQSTQAIFLTRILVQFFEWMLNESTNLASTNNTIAPTQVSRGNKRHSSLTDTSMSKRPRPPHPSNVKAGMSNRKSSP
ncbi:hypothetical protein V6N11_033782 [Hibiscus sabdariffa]|uniref:Uncharacterized protein n=1 Tax=Hibiscus sabdariffa TaxID=183260 RepID=A0ABR2S0E0_9ROSI